MHGKNYEGCLISLVVERGGLHRFSYPPFHRLLEFVAIFCAAGLHWELGWVAVVLLLLLVPPVLPSLVLGSCASAAGTDHLGVMLHPLQQPHSHAWCLARAL